MPYLSLSLSLGWFSPSVQGIRHTVSEEDISKYAITEAEVKGVITFSMKLKPKQVDAKYKALQQQPESAVGSSNNKKPESASLFWSRVLE